MFTTVFLASIMIGAATSLLYAIRFEDRELEIISKTAASFVFVILGIVRWSAGDIVGGWLVAGLILCAVGDFCLLWDRSFDIGLLSFLLGHLAYGAGFGAALAVRQWPLMVLIPLLVAGGAASSWLWPHLGKRRTPVTAYVVAITFMLWGGLSTSISAALPWTAAAGAFLFYLSDLAVARQRFIHQSFINRGLGLPSYYLGQFLIAMTVGAGR